MQARLPTTERRGRAMGTRVHIVVVGGGPQLAEDGFAALEHLESRWSRFRADSEISRLNEAAGAPVVVSAVTFDLLERAVAESRATGGAFDPTVLPALLAAGYDRDFAAVTGTAGVAAPPVPAPGISGIELDPLVRSVRLPPGTAVDVGGIGKGFAADLVAGIVCERGAAGVCVNLGGDLRVIGNPPDERAWTVAIEVEPGDVTTPEMSRGTLQLIEGGVATTSARRKVWTRGDTVQHHVIDPRTGAPAIVPWGSVTVVAGNAASAEVGATAAFLAGDVATAAEVLEVRGAVGVAIDDAGTAHALGNVAPYLVGQGLPHDLAAT